MLIYVDAGKYLTYAPQHTFLQSSFHAATDHCWEFPTWCGLPPCCPINIRFHSNIWFWVSQGGVTIRARKIGWICIHLLQCLEICLKWFTTFLKTSSPMSSDTKILPSSAHPSPIHQLSSLYLTLCLLLSQILMCPENPPIRAHNGLTGSTSFWKSSMALWFWNPLNLFAEQASLVFKYVTQALVCNMWSPHLGWILGVLLQFITQDSCCAKARSPENLQRIVDVIFFFY